MSNIWLISDTHFNHNKDFIWKARGFNSVEEMNETIIKNWNDVIQPDDVIYHLGDVIMGELDAGIPLVKRLNGKIKLAIGNHDTTKRLAAFKELFDEINFGYRLKKGKKTFLLTHYPTLVANYNDPTKVYSIHGHTHSPNAFCEYPLMYNVNCDAHDCKPILFEDVIEDIYSHK